MGKLETSSHEKIGEYALKRSGSNLVLTCRIDPIVYNRTDVAAYQFLTLNLKDESLDGTYPLITAGEGDVDIRIKFVRDLNDPDDLKGSYEIEKRGPDQINSPQVPYTIIASVKGSAPPEADLTGKYIIDSLPKELVLEAGADFVKAGSPMGTWGQKPILWTPGIWKMYPICGRGRTWKA